MQIVPLVSSISAALFALVLYSHSESLLGSLCQEPLTAGSSEEFPLYSNVTAHTEWDVVRHLGGNSPWIRKTENILSHDTETPQGCILDQVHMMSRHAERYPTVKAGARMLQLFWKIQHSENVLNGTLEFANNWDFFAPDPSTHFEHLVETGPHAGTLQAFHTGVKLRTRYEALHDKAVSQKQTTYWASDSPRVIDTAKYFAAGFFGLEGMKHADLSVISESSDLGANTLTPGDTCLNYANDVDDRGHGYGANMLAGWKETYTESIIDHFAETNPNLPFSADEVYAMQEICGFETIAHGKSPWCDIFTDKEWEKFEYARDLLHYYRAGSGNPYAATMGWLWLNATANLVRRGPAAGPLFFSFAHDGGIVPVLAALGLYDESFDLPTDRVPIGRRYRLSSTVPMGGRIIFERLTCLTEGHCWDNAPLYPNHVYCEPPRNRTYVRLNINDGIVGIPGCGKDTGGPAELCSLDEFLDQVKAIGDKAGVFGEVCGLDENAEKKIEFLHQ
ncbi:phosphoglycerate mutase-like protein [Polychaeton citri CBS 116435]|uniref:Phosphoglycerate mutase-like protein n=1 Tax=Polychaeton citri CBS 116435 TaxID=1314669 RepID=A0A9P4QCH8_9PEZI|nr:phosphoglycerate mutase-like protein [Polychaeton citri CBS 116435]